MIKLLDHFDNELKKAKLKYHTEPKIVKAFVKAINTPSPILITGGRVDIKSKFIHQRPYVFFVSPSSLHQAGRTELGDLLIVIKEIRRGKLKRRRCVLLQVKKTMTDSIILTPHQHDFQRDLYSIAFQFGKHFYNQVQMEPIIWSHVTHSKWFIANLFLYPNCDCVSCARDINSSLVSYRLDSYPCKSSLGIHYRDFLNDFFHFSKVGVSLKDQIQGIVELIYKRYDWELDPEQEWFDNFGNRPGEYSDDEGFGIIECAAYYDDYESV